jgi:hypothetical protein
MRNANVSSPVDSTVNAAVHIFQFQYGNYNFQDYGRETTTNLPHNSIPINNPWLMVVTLLEDVDDHYASLLPVLCTEKYTAILCLAENASIPHDDGRPTSSTTDTSNSSGSPPQNNTGHDVTTMDVAGYRAIFDGLAASKLIHGAGNGDAKLTLTEKEQQSESEDVIAQYHLFLHA